MSRTSPIRRAQAVKRAEDFITPLVVGNVSIVCWNHCAAGLRIAEIDIVDGNSGAVYMQSESLAGNVLFAVERLILEYQYASDIYGAEADEEIAAAEWRVKELITTGGV